MTARLIVLEGSDASGKGTQSKLLASTLRSRGLRVALIEPTKAAHPLGRRAIYGMLTSGSAKRNPLAFQLIQFVNRMYFQLRRLPKLLAENDVVVMDRWALSGYVYGSAEGIEPIFNRWMYSVARAPDLTLVMVGASYDRPGPVDSYELDEVLQSRVRSLYRSSTLFFPNIVTVDNHDGVDEIHASVIACLELHGLVEPVQA